MRSPERPIFASKYKGITLLSLAGTMGLRVCCMPWEEHGSGLPILASFAWVQGRQGTAHVAGEPDLEATELELEEAQAVQAPRPKRGGSEEADGNADAAPHGKVRDAPMLVQCWQQSFLCSEKEFGAGRCRAT
jgi:hypothetical protein